MRRTKNKSVKASAKGARSKLIILGFGLAVLGVLVSIDHPEWFRLRPVTGSAVAMSLAGGNAMSSTTQP